MQPLEKSDKGITFGPYQNIAPFTRSALAFSFLQKEALPYVTSLTRIVEVSHWGSTVSISDVMNITNIAPPVIDEFSRLKYSQAIAKYGFGSDKNKKVRVAFKPDGTFIYLQIVSQIFLLCDSILTCCNKLFVYFTVDVY